MTSCEIRPAIDCSPTAASPAENSEVSPWRSLVAVIVMISPGATDAGIGIALKSAVPIPFVTTVWLPR